MSIHRIEIVLLHGYFLDKALDKQASSLPRNRRWFANRFLVFRIFAVVFLNILMNFLTGFHNIPPEGEGEI